MKGMFLSVSLLFMVAQITTGQEISVRSQKDPDTDFGKYTTYYWAEQVDKVLDEGRFFLNDLILKADIRNAVRAELDAHGYKLQPNNPDLIVNFRVFEKKTQLKGYQGYGSTFWGPHEYNAAFDNKIVEVEAGTLILCIVDRVSKVLIWQGMAFGLNDHDAFTKDEGKIREAISLLLDDYGIRVAEYTRR